jgi:LPXTG-motif cell wall-anchored protein
MAAVKVHGGGGRCRYAVPPMRRRLIAALAAVALFALPAAALAQSAGDDQYSDPFGDVDQPTQDQGGANESPAPAAEPTGEAPAAESAAAADQGSGGTLPHTGFPAALSALLGALLVGAGVSVRRRAQPPVALPPWLVPAGSHRGRFGGRRRFRR